LKNIKTGDSFGFVLRVKHCVGVESFEVRKQHLLTSYFGFSSTEELKNDIVNYQHTFTSQTIDCAAIVNCRFRFVAAYIDVLVVIKLRNGYS